MTNPIYVFNKYYTLYNNIISLAISKNRYKLNRTDSNYIYYENHHIIPKSFGGSNKNPNMVLLTGREHYLCHYLLTKFTLSKNKSKMIFAFHLMNISTKHQQRHFNSRLYENTRINLGKHISQLTKGKLKPMSEIHRNNLIKALKDIPKSKEHRNKISKSLTGKFKSQEFKDNQSNIMIERHKNIDQTGKNNHMYKGIYVTPWGKFNSYRTSSTSSLVSSSSIQKWCNNPTTIIKKSNISWSKYLQSLKESPLGKTFRELGFDFEPNSG